MNVEFYRMRIDSVHEAANRSRRVFAASTIAAIAMIGATWNSAFSWLRAFPLGMSSFATDQVVADMQRALLREWVGSMFINVPLLGIRFSVADASVIGSLSLTILTVWIFYSLRRENHLIGQTLRDASDEPQETKAYVYHGIVGAQVFATLSMNDEPFRSLDGPRIDRTLPGIRSLSRMLLYLPAIAIVLVVISDLMSVFWFPAVFRDQHKPLGEILPTSVVLLDVAPRDLTAMAFAAISGILLRRARAFQDGNISLLHEVANQGWSKTPPAIEAARLAEIR